MPGKRKRSSTASVDTTDRKRAEEAFKLQQAYFQQLFDNSPNGIALLDDTDRVVNINKGFETLFGYRTEEIKGRFINDIVVPEDRIEEASAMSRAALNGEVFRKETVRKRKDSSLVDVSILGYPVRFGNKTVGIYAIYSDITERKRAEEELIKEKERAEGYLNIAGVMLATVDADENITLINNKGCEILGYKEGELIGRNWFNTLVPQRIRGEIRDIFRKLMAGDIEPVEYYENPLLTKNGEERLVAFHNTVIRDPNGQIVGALFSGEDITERKRMEEALWESENKLQTYLESAPDGVYINDLKGTFLYGNKKAEAIMGYKREELLGKSFLKLNLLPAKYLVKAGKLLALNAMGKPTGPDEFELIKRDGSRIWVEITTTPIKQAEGKTEVIGFARDITERKRVEEALLKSEEKYRTLFESKLDGMIVIDETMKPLLANKTAAEMFGFDSLEELLEVNIFDYIPPEERERALKIITKDMFEKDMRQVNEFRLRTKSGEEMWVSAIGALTEYEGKVAGLISLRDITERKRMEEKLISSERLAAIGQLASGVAHELRGPLGAIKTAAFYVQRRLAKSDLPATEPKVLEFLDIIDGQVNIASNVISDLIDFSRVAKPTFSPVNIGGIIEDALKHVPIPENVNLARDIDESLPMVMVDAGQIQRVFVNVIFNAVEAMPQGGRLGIRAGSKGEFVEVEFTDTGCGIPRSDIDNIFDPLFTTKARGIGLGLAVCKGIMERHGGGIGVKSKVGKGSTFTVSLPAQVI